MTSCRFSNWSKECEDIVNQQINLEYWASYQYHLMWSYFDRSDIGLHNIADFFKKSSLEEREHAHKLMEYQNLRGGKVVLTNVEARNLDYLNNQPNSNHLLLSFQKALDMEQSVYNSLLEVHKTGESENDPQFTDFIEGQFLGEQVQALNEVAKHVTQLQLIGNDGHGVWNFDQEFEN